ncbi:Spy/CpxP family protein refolding chaperone [Comamonas sp. MYb69]|uniref:Spy/CpxP family protein refolding chaperone n=1 Tax=Comamonas sp. MYb69 TaxID=1848650 RepID=UPI0030B3AB27
MSLLQRSAIVTAMLASLSVSSFAQTPAAPAAAPTTQSAPAPAKKAHGPEAREAHMAKRMQTLKASLKLNASQEAGWTSYMAAVKPQRPAPGDRPERPDFAKMTTPERIDAMAAMHAKHQAAMDQRNQATKAFYASLTPEQQKTFDAETLKMHERRGRGPDGKGPHGQRHQGPNPKQTVPPMDSK